MIFFEIKVLDRSMLILDIFAMRAKSGEGKLQNLHSLNTACRDFAVSVWK